MGEGQRSTYNFAEKPEGGAGEKPEGGAGKPLCPWLMLSLACLPLSLGDLTNHSPLLGASFPYPPS